MSQSFVSTAHAHAHAHPSHGHGAAAHMRRKAQVTVLPPQRADGLIWGAMLVLAVLGLGGLAAGLWWAKRPPAEPHMVEMRIGQERLVFPSSYLGPRPPDLAREVGMTRLRVTWPELTAPALGDKAEVHITVGPADPATDPTAHFATLARFLSPGAWSNPGGLVTRGFKAGSPFAADELHMSLPDGAAFFARCTADIGQTRMDEGCRAVLKHRDFDITLRFPREALSDWRGLSERARALIDSFRRPL